MAQFGRRGGKGGGGNRGGFRPGGKGGFGGGRGRDSRPAEMHEATCAKCNKICEVPFRPTGDRPVYCKDCFGGGPSREGGRFEKREKRDFAPRREHDRDSHDGTGHNELKKTLEEVTTELRALSLLVRALSVSPKNTKERAVKETTKKVVKKKTKTSKK